MILQFSGAVLILVPNAAQVAMYKAIRSHNNQIIDINSEKKIAVALRYMFVHFLIVSLGAYKCAHNSSGHYG